MPEFQTQQPLLDPPQRRPRDSRGYTMPTLIVSALMVAAAVGASVILYRAFTSNTDVRAFSDISVEYVPGRPHSFSHTSSVSDDVMVANRVVTVTVSWLPPESGVDGATTPSLSYKAEYICKDGSDGMVTQQNVAVEEDETATTADLDQPSLELSGNQALLGDAFQAGRGGLVGHCLLQVRTKGPSDELGAAAEYRFSISRLPTVPENAKVETSPTDKLIVYWDTPSYLGAGDVDNVIYRVQASQRMISAPPAPYAPASGNCTLNNFYSLDPPSAGETWDLRVTPIVVTNSTQMATFREASRSAGGSQTCPAVEFLLQPAAALEGTYLELLGLQPEAAAPARPAASNFSLQPADASGDASALVEAGPGHDTVTIKATWHNSPGDFYLLEWSRADGTGVSRSLETTETLAFLTLDHGQAYNFKLFAGNSNGYSAPLEACTVVATRNRYLAPEVTADPIAGFYLAVAVSSPDPARHCSTATYCLEAAVPVGGTDPNVCQPMAPNFYRVRAYAVPTDTNCPDTASTFPNKTCRDLSDPDQVTCLANQQGAIPEPQIFNVLPNIEYAIEAIAGHSCSDGTLANNAASNDEAYASFPTAVTARAPGNAHDGNELGAVRSLAVEASQVWSTGTWMFDQTPNSDMEIITLTFNGTPDRSYKFKLDTSSTDTGIALEPVGVSFDETPFTAASSCDVNIIQGTDDAICTFRFAGKQDAPNRVTVTDATEMHTRIFTPTGLQPTDTPMRAWQITWDPPNKAAANGLESYVLTFKQISPDGDVDFILRADFTGQQTLAPEPGIVSATCDFPADFANGAACQVVLPNAVSNLAVSVTSVYANDLAISNFPTS